MARRVDEVERVDLPVLPAPVEDPGRLELDGDPPLALQVERVQELLGHVPVGHRGRGLQEAVGQRRLAVVDVRDDGEVADPGGGEALEPGVLAGRRRGLRRRRRAGGEGGGRVLSPRRGGAEPRRERAHGGGEDRQSGHHERTELHFVCIASAVDPL